jgi:hypothetical protein
MPRSLSIAEVLDVLQAGDFGRLDGVVEDHQLEFKASPYQLSSDAMKCELAKDVSALANSSGGIILIGFRTCQDSLTATEYVDLCRPFDLSLFDTDQHRKILNDWICPPINPIDIRCYPSASESDKGVAAIIIAKSAAEGRPYIVSRTVEADGKKRGTLFGYYERIQDRIPATSPEVLRGYVKDGMRFEEIMRRLDTIESFLGNSAPPVITGLTEAEVSDRICEAQDAVGRASRPNIVLAAISTSECTFPDLFHSRSAPIVRLIEEPPVMREEGFAITPRGRDIPAEIVQGRLRRVAARGFKLIELWQDGALITVGPADDDMLCWFMRNQRNPKPGLPIRNFVLAEVTLNFCRLVIEVFSNAVPQPRILKLTLRLENMTEDDIPCKLSPSPDNKPNLFSIAEPRTAPSSTISSSITASFAGIDAGIIAYRLLGGVYAEFGFNHEEMPYIQHDPDGNRITPESLFGKAV